MRPMALKRFVHGAEGEFFFQKRAPDSRPDWIETAELRFPSGRTADEIAADHHRDGDGLPQAEVAVARDEHFIAALLQQVFERGDNVRLVVGYQDAHGYGSLVEWSRERSISAR